MKNNRQTIDRFLALTTLAVVGVSRDTSKFGNQIYRAVKKSGRKVYAVNPNADMLEGDRSYAGLGALPEPAAGLILVIPPASGLEVIREAARVGIKYIWMQPGANSLEAETLCAELGLNCVSGECIFMYLEPVESVHKFHRGLRKFFGLMPK